MPTMQDERQHISVLRLKNEIRNSNLNNNYHIVLASDENIKYLEDFGGICACGYDVKHEFNAACFKVNILTYCELYSNGLKVGMAAISNCEISEVHKMQLEITITICLVIVQIVHVKAYLHF